MVLGFKEQFVQPILGGTKIHTIREDKNKRWTIGKKIHFATGTRTKNYNQFMEGECKGLQKIEITRQGIIISGKKLNYMETQILAYNDGFKHSADLMSWFKRDFEGIIIHWTDFLYL